MNEKKDSRKTEYKFREDTAPSGPDENINARNNNAADDDMKAAEPNIERANDAGIGDSGWNDEKLTNFTSNHSADA